MKLVRVRVQEGAPGGRRTVTDAPDGQMMTAELSLDEAHLLINGVESRRRGKGWEYSGVAIDYHVSAP